MYERKLLALESVALKMADGEDAMSFEGYASVFNGKDTYGDTILPGAFEKTLKKARPKMFFNHRSWGIPIGKWATLTEDKKGLFVQGEFTPGNAEAMQVRAAMQHGTIDGLSIGFMLKEGDTEETEKGRIIKRVSELVEVSVVTFPADRAARVDMTSVKASLDSITTLSEFEDFLREAGGFSRGVARAVASRFKDVALRDAARTGLEEKYREGDIMAIFERFRTPESLSLFK